MVRIKEMTCLYLLWCEKGREVSETCDIQKDDRNTSEARSFFKM